jgi:hypothetical protein
MKKLRTQAWRVLVGLCCTLAACESDGAEDRGGPSQGREPRSEAETKAPPEPEPAPPNAPVVPPLPPAPDPPGERIYAHRDAAAQAGRAILQGDLKTAAPHLAWLAHHAYPQKLPAGWQPHAARMQLAARVLARATTPGEALRALPALDAACGACHAALADTDFNATEGPLQHGDGTLALLDGLIGPAGALFASAAKAAPRVAGASDATALAALKTASARAGAAETWVERLAATEEIFGQCGSCHEGLR